MKKQLLSPICSALVVPGLGQILNQHLKKGLIIMTMVFILLVTATIKLAFILNRLLESPEISGFRYYLIPEKLRGEDLFVLWILLLIFGMIWLYSVVDAFLTGRKMDQCKGGDTPDRIKEMDTLT